MIELILIGLIMLVINMLFTFACTYKNEKEDTDNGDTAVVMKELKKLTDLSKKLDNIEVLVTKHDEFISTVENTIKSKINLSE